MQERKRERMRDRCGKSDEMQATRRQWFDKRKEDSVYLCFFFNEMTDHISRYEMEEGKRERGKRRR